MYRYVYNLVIIDGLGTRGVCARALARVCVCVCEYVIYLSMPCLPVNIWKCLQRSYFRLLYIEMPGIKNEENRLNIVLVQNRLLYYAFLPIINCILVDQQT